MVYNERTRTNQKENKNMTNKAYEEMTVEELRRETKERGMPQQENGKKFTKAELIQRLKEYDKKMNQTESKESVVKEETQNTEENKEGYPIQYNKERQNYKDVREAVDRVEKKYSQEKQPYVYDTVLKQGCFVVFVNYINLGDERIIKKLRTAKVTAVNRKIKAVKVETVFGTKFELSSSDLLYIKADKESEYYPRDIREVLKMQRTGRGARLMYEKFNGC